MPWSHIALASSCCCSWSRGSGVSELDDSTQPLLSRVRVRAFLALSLDSVFIILYGVGALKGVVCDTLSLLPKGFVCDTLSAYEVVVAGKGCA